MPQPLSILNISSLILKGTVQDLKVVVLVILEFPEVTHSWPKNRDSWSPVSVPPQPVMIDHSRKSDFSKPERNVGIRFILALRESAGNMVHHGSTFTGITENSITTPLDSRCLGLYLLGQQVGIFWWSWSEKFPARSTSRLR